MIRVQGRGWGFVGWGLFATLFVVNEEGTRGCDRCFDCTRAKLGVGCRDSSHELPTGA